MARVLFALASFLLVVGILAKDSIHPVGSNIQFVNDIEEFKKENPDIALQPLPRAVGQKTIRYTLGYRVSGDKIVAQGNNNFNYASPQDVRQNLWYPQSGIGLVVSFVEIVVDQTSDIGNAYVTSGGIGQRQITLVVEAKRTTRFTYRAAIYGY